MELITPSYYHRFRCIAADCPDSCCKEWTVQVDAASAAIYQALPGELGDHLRRVMVLEDGEWVLKLTADQRCPMWRDDGLCRIHAQLGEGALCNTCRDFPRLRHDYGDFVELGLELSCPEAAKWVLSAQTHEVDCAQVPGGEEPEYDLETMAILQRSRDEILSFLEDTSYPVNHALAILLLFGYDVQNELDGGQPATLQPDALLQEISKLKAAGSVSEILAFFEDLEVLTPQWTQLLRAPAVGAWCEEHRALARYFVSRYWLQAVSDFDLVCRVKFAVISSLVIKTVGGDIYRTAQLYSKEIENNQDNVDAILDGTCAAPALVDRNLLGLLLADSPTI